jgi:hypothetical protein
MALDTVANTATVGLVPADSSAKDKNYKTLDINHRSAVTLEDVPVSYMTCNAAAFSVDDSVVVMFEGQSWANPRVIGFTSNPKPCTSFVLALHGYFYNPGTAENEHRAMFVVLSSSGQKIAEGLYSDNVEGWRYLGAFTRSSGGYFFEAENDGGSVSGDDYKKIMNAQTGTGFALPDLMFQISRDKTELFSIDHVTQLNTIVLDSESLAIKRTMNTWPHSASGYAFVQDASFDYLIVGGWSGSDYEARIYHTNGSYVRSHAYANILWDVAVSKDYYSVLVQSDDGSSSNLFVHSISTGAEIDRMTIPNGFERITMNGKTIMALCSYDTSYAPYMGVLWTIEIIDGLLALVSETTPFSGLITAYGLTSPAWADVGR